MSRTKLKEIEEFRGTFTGIFERMGSKSGWKGSTETTVLLIDIQDENGIIITEHLWFNYTKGFRELGTLTVGDSIQFNARVKKYYKGYQGYSEEPWNRETDYKLSHPTKITNLTHPEKRIVPWEEKAKKCPICGKPLAESNILGKIDFYCRKCKKTFD